jgi:hypothetical protein
LRAEKTLPWVKRSIISAMPKLGAPGGIYFIKETKYASCSALASVFNIPTTLPVAGSQMSPPVA